MIKQLLAFSVVGLFAYWGYTTFVHSYNRGLDQEIHKLEALISQQEDSLQYYKKALKDNEHTWQKVMYEPGFIEAGEPVRSVVEKGKNLRNRISSVSSHLKFNRDWVKELKVEKL